jgi:hypothetical protein
VTGSSSATSPAARRSSSPIPSERPPPYPRPEAGRSAPASPAVMRRKRGSGRVG